MDQQQKVIKESLNLNSSLMEFTGPKLTKLVLTRLDGKSTVEVISPFEDCNEFTKCGSFIMYPWVGRLTSTENLFKYMGKEVKEFPKMDISRGFPLHGFFLTADRKVVAKDNNTISFESIDTSYFDLFPKFTEKYILKDSTLEIETTFENTTDKTQYFAYGYHPYLGIDSTSINDLKINTNITLHYDQQPNLVPNVNEKGEILLGSKNLNGLIAETTYDDLFYYNSTKDENPFIEFIKESKDSKEIRVRYESDRSYLPLKYCQVYTPEARKSFAVEFMSSINNAFNIDYPNNLVQIKPCQKLTGVSRISVN